MNRIRPAIDPHKILIVKPSSLGDVVHSLPFLNALSKCFPAAEIHWVIAQGFEGLLEAHPMIRGIWVIKKDSWKKIQNAPQTIQEIKVLFNKLKQEKYDLVIDLQGLLRSGVITGATGSPLRIGFKEAREGSRIFYTHTVEGGKNIHAVDRYLKIAEFIGCDISEIRFPFPDFTNNYINTPSQLSFPQPRTCCRGIGNPSENKNRFRTSRNDGLATGSGFIDNLRIPHLSYFDLPENYAVIVPGARWKTKRWPAEKFGRLASLLNVNTVIIGSKSDSDIADQIVALSNGKAVSFAGKTELNDLINIIGRARFAVSNDSGPMHIAAALGIPVFAIFGPTDPRRTGPYGEGHTIIRSEISCAPCFKKTCDKVKCLKSISVDEVFEIIASKQHLRKFSSDNAIEL